jgi:hypothetical protein
MYEEGEDTYRGPPEIKQKQKKEVRNEEVNPHK